MKKSVFVVFPFALNIGTFSVSAGAYSFIIVMQNPQTVKAEMYFVIPVNIMYFPSNAEPLYKIDV